MILIISFEDNEHVERVRQHLSVPSVVVDTSWFPAELELDARLGADVESLRLARNGHSIDLAEIGAVWCRRLRGLTIDEQVIDETARLFAWSESNEALQGLWYSVQCFWMNPPAADEVGQRKIRQLQIARRIGLSIPETLVTNNPAEARDFVEQYEPGNVVRKAFRNIPQAPRETMLVREEDLALMDSVRYAPVIFQSFVPVEADLRVTVVEDEIFAAAVYSEKDFDADYRRGLGSAKVVPYTLPEDVASGLLDLMRELDLRFGAIDLRVTPDGEHVFLEVNPAGEYLFISERTGQPIPQAIAACLERHDREAGS